MQGTELFHWNVIWTFGSDIITVRLNYETRTVQRSISLRFLFSSVVSPDRFDRAKARVICQ